MKKILPLILILWITFSNINASQPNHVYLAYSVFITMDPSDYDIIGQDVSYIYVEIDGTIYKIELE
jgi:hypothetical protein